MSSDCDCIAAQYLAAVDPFLLYSNAVLLMVGPTSLKVVALHVSGPYIGKAWPGSADGIKSPSKGCKTQ